MDLEDKKDKSGDSNTYRSRPVHVWCGANDTWRDEVEGVKIRDIRRMCREELNITEEHTIVLLNGKQVYDEDYVLLGGEELDFKRPSGHKGQNGSCR